MQFQQSYLKTFLLAVLAVALSSCGGENAQKEGENAETSGAGGGEKRIVTLNATLTEIVFALEAGDNVVGTDMSSKYPAPAAELPKVGYYRMVDAEKILGLKPTHALVVPETGPEKVLNQLEEAGVQLQEFTLPEDPTKAPELVRQVGEAIGAGEVAEQKAAAMEEQMNALAAALEGQQQKPRVLCFYDRGGLDQLYLMGKGTVGGGFIELAGGEQPLDFEGHKSITPEAVIDADPQYLIMPASTLEAFGGVQAVKDHKILGQTTAAKEGNIITLEGPKLFGFGAHTAETAWELARKLGTVAEEEPA
mgnify:CR=1 FL=1